MWFGDAVSTRGSRHLRCEDWAEGDPEGRWALVADGCSSSEATCIGATIVGRSAAQLLDQGCFDIATCIEKAAALAAALALPVEALDCTLLVARRVEDHTEVLVWGDGHIGWEDGSGQWVWCHVEHPDEMPWYPSYLLCDDRAATWHRFAEGATVSGMDEFVVERSPHNTRLHLPSNASVFLSTDGVGHVDGAETEALLQAISSLSLRTPGCLTRRVRKLVERRWPRDGVRPQDDLGFALLTKHQ